MFSFHKPKVYRSSRGCCICRAKSSSSRFTESNKYEKEFRKCFRLVEHRRGEICNACVLLVKRWQKLPPGSTRNWHHVVDARAGPGSKSITKIKNKAAQALNNKKRKCVKSAAQRAAQNANKHHREQCAQENIVDLHIKKTRSSAYARQQENASPTFSDNSDDVEIGRILAGSKISSFLDLSYWKCTKVCCGVIFKGPNDEVMLDPRFFRPCSAHKKPSTSNDQSEMPSTSNDQSEMPSTSYDQSEMDANDQSEMDGLFNEPYTSNDQSGMNSFCNEPTTSNDQSEMDGLCYEPSTSNDQSEMVGLFNEPYTSNDQSGMSDFCSGPSTFNDQFKMNGLCSGRKSLLGA